jgi:hypothetical protein
VLFGSKSWIAAPAGSQVRRFCSLQAYERKTTSRAMVMTKNNLKVAVSALVLCGAFSAHAQYIRPTYAYPGDVPASGGVELGDSGFFAKPFIGFGYGHDDNLFLQPNNTKSSPLLIASPGVKLDARRPGLVVQADYQVQAGHYTDSENDNYVDQNLGFQVDSALNERTFVRVGYGYVRGHDPRGSTDRPFSTHPDKYKLSTPNGTFAYGAPGAQGRVEVYYSDAHRDYLNNQDVTRVSDRDETTTGAAFYWRVGPKTYALIEGRDTKIDYDIQNPLSGHEHRAFLGVTWEATAATTGTFKVGQMKRDFDGPTPANRSTAWEGLVTWAPRTYSKFDLYTSRTTNESTGLGNFILTSVGGVTWSHGWTTYLSTEVLARYQRDAYQGFDRTDNTKSLGLKVGYRFRPWLTLGGEWTYTTRDSNLNQFDYDKNFYLLTATASM